MSFSPCFHLFPFGQVRQKAQSPALCAPQEDICHFPFLTPPPSCSLLAVKQSSCHPEFPWGTLMATTRDLVAHTRSKKKWLLLLCHFVYVAQTEKLSDSPVLIFLFAHIQHSLNAVYSSFICADFPPIHNLMLRQLSRSLALAVRKKPVKFPTGRCNMSLLLRWRKWTRFWSIDFLAA